MLKKSKCEFSLSGPNIDKKKATMNNFFELVHLLNRYKIRQIEILSNPEKGANPSRYRLLYDAVWEGKVRTLEEAAALFGMTPNDKVFKRLISGLKKRLHNTLFFIDMNQPDFNNPQRALSRCIQLQSVMQLLIWRGAPQNAVEIAGEILAVALKYRFSWIAADAARILKRWYSIYQPDASKFAHYALLAEEQARIWRQEDEATDLFLRLQLLNTSSKSIEPEIAEKAADYFRRLEPWRPKIPTVFFQQPSRLIEIAALMGQKNWQRAESASREAIDYFRRLPHAGKQSTVMFYQQLAVALLMQGKFVQAREAAQSAIKLGSSGAHHWFKTLELQIAIELHAGQYAHAWDIWTKAVQHPQFIDMPAVTQLPWQLYKAYFFLLIRAKLLQVDPRTPLYPEDFCISRLIADLPAAARDKQGRNIPMLMAQIMLLLLEKRLDEAEYRIEALRKYRQRRLNGQENRQRTIMFIQLLESLVNSGFGHKPLHEKARQTIAELPRIPIAMYEVEIIPYQVLWQMLEKQFFPSEAETISS